MLFQQANTPVNMYVISVDEIFLSCLTAVCFQHEINYHLCEVDVRCARQWIKVWLRFLNMVSSWYGGDGISSGIKRVFNLFTCVSTS